MINTFDILETIKMIQDECLDIEQLQWVFPCLIVLIQY